LRKPSNEIEHHILQPPGEDRLTEGVERAITAYVLVKLAAEIINVKGPK